MWGEIKEERRTQRMSAAQGLCSEQAFLNRKSSVNMLNEILVLFIITNIKY